MSLLPGGLPAGVAAGAARPAGRVRCTANTTPIRYGNVTRREGGGWDVGGHQAARVGLVGAAAVNASSWSIGERIPLVECLRCGL